MGGGGRRGVVRAVWLLRYDVGRWLGRSAVHGKEQADVCVESQHP